MHDRRITCLVVLFPTGILVPPPSLTVGVDSIANCCTATGSLFNWFIDGKHESDEMNRRRGISAVETEDLNGHVVGILTIPATTRNNNTVIYCSVAGTNGIRRSPTATLTMQGNWMCNHIIINVNPSNLWWTSLLAQSTCQSKNWWLGMLACNWLRYCILWLLFRFAVSSSKSSHSLLQWSLPPFTTLERPLYTGSHQYRTRHHFIHHLQ